MKSLFCKSARRKKIVYGIYKLKECLWPRTKICFKVGLIKKVCVLNLNIYEGLNTSIIIMCTRIFYDKRKSALEFYILAITCLL